MFVVTGPMVCVIKFSPEVMSSILMLVCLTPQLDLKLVSNQIEHSLKLNVRIRGIIVSK